MNETTTPADVNVCAAEHDGMTLAESPLDVRYHRCACGRGFNGNAHEVRVDESTGALVLVAQPVCSFVGLGVAKSVPAAAWCFAGDVRRVRSDERSGRD
jgi:hypothetical protein